MKVYIVIAKTEYESSQIVDIYDSEDKAEARAQALIADQESRPKAGDYETLDDEGCDAYLAEIDKWRSEHPASVDFEFADDFSIEEFEVL